jgi:hypothetical protein
LRIACFGFGVVGGGGVVVGTVGVAFWVGNESIG